MREKWVRENEFRAKINTLNVAMEFTYPNSLSKISYYLDNIAKHKQT